MTVYASYRFEIATAILFIVFKLISETKSFHHYDNNILVLIFNLAFNLVLITIYQVFRLKLYNTCRFRKDSEEFPYPICIHHDSHSVFPPSFSNGKEKVNPFALAQANCVYC